MLPRWTQCPRRAEPGPNTGQTLNLLICLCSVSTCGINAASGLGRRTLCPTDLWHPMHPITPVRLVVGHQRHLQLVVSDRLSRRHHLLWHRRLQILWRAADDKKLLPKSSDG